MDDRNTIENSRYYVWHAMEHCQNINFKLMLDHEGVETIVGSFLEVLKLNSSGVVMKPVDFILDLSL